jgi:hypothetical protein
MKDGKIVDCVKFKHDLQKKLRKDSGAKNLSEYVKYINEIGMQSPIWKETNDNTINKPKKELIENE